jgi:hypothetical protein
LRCPCLCKPRSPSPPRPTQAPRRQEQPREHSDSSDSRNNCPVTPLSPLSLCFLSLFVSVCRGVGRRACIHARARTRALGFGVGFLPSLLSLSDLLNKVSGLGLTQCCHPAVICLIRRHLPAGNSLSRHVSGSGRTLILPSLLRFDPNPASVSTLA